MKIRVIYIVCLLTGAFLFRNNGFCQLPVDDIHLLYLKGSYKAVIRITSPDSSVFAVVDHYSATNSQKVINKGYHQDGRFFQDIELNVILPDSLTTKAPFPVKPAAGIRGRGWRHPVRYFFHCSFFTSRKCSEYLLEA